MSGIENPSFRKVVTPQGIVYLHSMPGRFEPWLAFENQLQESGVSKILCLTPRAEILDKSPEYAIALQQDKFQEQVVECPIDDFSIASDLQSYRQIILTVARYVKAGETVLIHCAAGIGRTGTAACCLLLELGSTLKEALEMVKVAGSGAETAEQQAFISDYEKTIHGNVIRCFTEADFESVQTIYLEGIASGNATFQTERKSWQQWQESMVAKCRIVACDQQGRVIGWAGLSAISSREVYQGVAEVSVYLARRCQGQGVGKQLLSALIEASQAEGYWTLQAAIFPENKASLGLHYRCGFKLIGQRDKLGKLKGRWRDVQLLERRSETVGIS